jgi:hypothetical protein
MLHTALLSSKYTISNEGRDKKKLFIFLLLLLIELNKISFFESAHQHSNIEEREEKFRFYFLLAD